MAIFEAWSPEFSPLTMADGMSIIMEVEDNGRRVPYQEIFGLLERSHIETVDIIEEMIYGT